MNGLTEKEAMEAFQKMPPGRKREVLNFIEFLERKPISQASHPEQFHETFGTISAEGAAEMEAAIEEYCGELDPDDRPTQS